MGFWWSLFFNFFLTPLAGILIIENSPYTYEPPKKGTYFGRLCALMAIGFSILTLILGLLNNSFQSKDAFMYIFSIGLFGFGYYTLRKPRLAQPKETPVVKEPARVLIDLPESVLEPVEC